MAEYWIKKTNKQIKDAIVLAWTLLAHELATLEARNLTTNDVTQI